MGILSTGSVTLVDLTDQRPFQFYLETQGSRVQSKGEDETYQPDYTKTSITIKPKLFFGNDDGTKHIVQDAINYTINGVAVDSSNTIGYKNGINCVINKNIPLASKVQLIEATLETTELKDPKTDVKINNGNPLKASIELVLNTQGSQGPPGPPGLPGVKGDSMVSREAYWIKSSISPEPPDPETGGMKGWIKGSEPPESALDGIQPSDKFWRIYKETYSNGESEYNKYSEVELIGSYEILNGLVQFRNGVATTENGITVIDGGKIHTKSIKADRIQVEDLEAICAKIGGFNISKTSIYSGNKNSIDNTEKGIYLDSNGQLCFGDDKNFIRFYQSDEDNYKIEINADSLTFGSSASVEKAIGSFGRNLIVEKTIRDGWINENGILDNSQSGYVATDYISVSPGDTIIFQLWAPKSERLWIDDTYFDSNKNYVTGYNGEWIQSDYIIKSYTVPNGVSYVIMSYSWADGYKVKLEKGNKPTDWSPAPEDVDAGIANAQETADSIADNIYVSGSSLIDGSKINDSSLSINQMDDTVAGTYSDPSTKRGIMEWKDDALHIKSVDANAQNTYETVIGGDGIKFNWNGTETASINQDELRINKTVVINAMDVGNWSWAIHPTTGNLMVKWNGGE